MLGAADSARPLGAPDHSTRHGTRSTPRLTALLVRRAAGRRVSKLGDDTRQRAVLRLQFLVLGFQLL